MHRIISRNFSAILTALKSDFLSDSAGFKIQEKHFVILSFDRLDAIPIKLSRFK